MSMINTKEKELRKQRRKSMPLHLSKKLEDQCNKTYVDKANQ